MTFEFNIAEAFQYEAFMVSDIHASLECGDSLALIGANGSGKSTLLKSLSLFRAPQRGLIKLAKETVHDTLNGDTVGLPNSDMIYLSQDSDAWPTLTVEQNLTISPLRDEKLLVELIDLFALQTLLRRKSWQLSGGERQRVNLARALSLNAPVTLLDEPTSALSFSYCESLQEWIQERRGDGKIFLVVTHSLRFCESVATKYIFLEGGIVAESGLIKHLRQSENKNVRRWIEY